MTKPVIRIAVVSDIVCPWCYIGKRRLEKAIERLEDQYTFEIAYYPFELNPEMPAEGRDQKTYLSQKFGDESEYERKTGHVTAIAETEGLQFNYEKQSISPNTRNAHRLVLFAKENNKHLEMVEALFRGYFTDGIDLSKHDNLLNIAVNVGLDKTKTDLFLRSDIGTAEVAMAEQELHKMGISGVPFYIVNDKYGISGAQATETFVEAITNIGKELSQAGEACEVDKNNC
jgi:predicted DsbA family dithiol-disulfide isomerase